MGLEERTCKRFGVREIKLLKIGLLNYLGKIKLQVGGGIYLYRANPTSLSKRKK